MWWFITVHQEQFTSMAAGNGYQSSHCWSYGVHNILQATQPLSVQCNLLQNTSRLAFFPKPYFCLWFGLHLWALLLILTAVLLRCLVASATHQQGNLDKKPYTHIPLMMNFSRPLLCQSWRLWYSVSKNTVVFIFIFKLTHRDNLMHVCEISF